jgi:hypothetical protein
MPPAAKSASEADTLKDLQALATEFLKYAAVVSCPKKDCTILVTNFVLPDGNTSPYGVQLADELSKELAGQNSKIRVIDRGHLQALLTKDRVPAKSINERLARSIAFALKATFVILGTTKKTGDDEVQLSTRLLDVADMDWSGYSAVINTSPQNRTWTSLPLNPLPLFRRLHRRPAGNLYIGPESTASRYQTAFTSRVPHIPKGLDSLSSVEPFQLRPLSIPRAS